MKSKGISLEDDEHKTYGLSLHPLSTHRCHNSAPWSNLPPKNTKSPFTKQCDVILSYKYKEANKIKETEANLDGIRNTSHEKDNQNSEDYVGTRTNQQEHYQINTNVREEDSAQNKNDFEVQKNMNTGEVKNETCP